MEVEYHSFFWRIQMIQAARPVTTVHSFSEGATTFSITQKFRDLITAIGNVFDRIFRFLLPFLYSKKAATQPIATVSQTVATPAAKTVAQVAATHIVTKPPEKTTLAPERSLTSAPTYPPTAIAPAPAKATLSAPTYPPTVPAPVPAAVVPAPAPQPVAVASAPIIAPASEPKPVAAAVVVAPAPVVVAAVQPPSVLDLAMKHHEELRMKRDSDAAPVVAPQASFDDVVQKLRGDSDDDAVLVSPQGPIAKSAGDVPELEFKEEGDKKKETDPTTRFTVKMWAKATLERNAALDLIDPPKASGLKGYETLKLPDRIKAGAVEGTSVFEKDKHRAAICLQVEAMPVLYSKIAAQQPVSTELLDGLLKDGLALADESKILVTDEPIPLQEAAKSIGTFDVLPAKGKEGKQRVGNIQLGSIQSLVSSLAYQAKNLPIHDADQLPFLSAFLFEGKLENPKVYGVFVQYNGRNCNYYLFDPYGQSLGDTISFRTFTNKTAFLEYLPGGDYSVISMAKKPEEPKKQDNSL